jgi:hypothetical protein
MTSEADDIRRIERENHCFPEAEMLAEQRHADEIRGICVRREKHVR